VEAECIVKLISSRNGCFPLVVSITAALTHNEVAPTFTKVVNQAGEAMSNDLAGDFLARVEVIAGLTVTLLAFD
jgi:hypothetical protein